MTDDQLRDALHDTASGVHPRGSFGDVRARASQRPDRGRRVLPVVAAAAAVVVVIGGIAWAARQQTPTITADQGRTPDQQPDASASPDQSAVTRPGEPRTSTVAVYYVGDTAAGPRLFREMHTLETTGTDVQAAVQEAIGSPPEDPDYDGWAAVDGLAATTEVHGDTITIDLSEPLRRPPGMDDEGAAIALQSLVWTADACSGNDLPVRFLVAGQPADELLGLSTTAPLAKASADSVLSAVSIASPAQGETVGGSFTVSGTAATFEANVVWELKQDGKDTRTGYTTATECCTLSPYSFTVTAPPGDYTLVVHDTDESDGEGVGTSQDTKEITVR